MALRPKARGPKDAKKLGGGGKFTIGKPGDELVDEDVSFLNQNQSSEPAIGGPEPYSSTGEQQSEHPDLLAKREIALHKMPLVEFKHRVIPLIKEFFVHGDVQDLRRSVLEIDAPSLHFELVKKAVTLALDYTGQEKELVSVMLSRFYPDLLSSEEIGKGFERLLESIDDVSLDSPDAAHELAKFIARAVNDEVLPPAWLTREHVQLIGGPVIEFAKALLSMEGRERDLDHIWGVNDLSEVGELKKEIKAICEEYFMAYDKEEVVHRLNEMNVPHFLHEFVKRAIVLSLDKDEEAQNLVLGLLQYVASVGVVTPSQMMLGFQRVQQEIDDLVLDNPRARDLFIEMEQQSVSVGTLPSDFRTLFDIVREGKEGEDKHEAP